MGKKGNESRQLVERVSAYIRKFHMIEPGDRVIVGLSGGADSVCLFLVLHSLREELGFSVEAVHVNHCMRDSAVRDENFVRNLCRAREIPLHVYSVDVPALCAQQGLSPEEAGRNARYDCFAQTMEKTGASKVAVAHHQNDQAETMLFHLARGTGIDGLVGMKPVRGRVIRPLLCVDREQIEMFLSECGQNYMTDETNASTQYSRNRMRLEVLPVLEDVCAGAVEHIAAAGETLRELSDYLRGQIREAVQECADLSEAEKGRIRLSCGALSELHEYMQGEVVRECIFLLTGSKKDISRVHVESVRKLANLQVGRKIDLPYGIEVEKSYETLVFSGEQCRADDAKRGEEFCVTLTAEMIETGAEVLLPDGKTMNLRTFAYNPEDEIPTKTYTKWLDCGKIDKPIEIRTPREDDFFYFNHKNKKYVKDYMVNEKIPVSERGKCILVASGSHMLYFAGKRISNGVLVDETTRKILEITVTGG